MLDLPEVDLVICPADVRLILSIILYLLDEHLVISVLDIGIQIRMIGIWKWTSN
jgi:hypothetical protein